MGNASDTPRIALSTDAILGEQHKESFSVPSSVAFVFSALANGVCWACPSIALSKRLLLSVFFLIVFL